MWEAKLRKKYGRGPRLLNLGRGRPLKTWNNNVHGDDIRRKRTDIDRSYAKSIEQKRMDIEE